VLPFSFEHNFLFRSFSKVRLEIVSGAGHSDSEPGIIDGLVRATDDFRHDNGATPGYQGNTLYNSGSGSNQIAAAMESMVKISEGSADDSDPALMP
jgi:hypothetical protein